MKKPGLIQGPGRYEPGWRSVFLAIAPMPQHEGGVNDRPRRDPVLGIGTEGSRGKGKPAANSYPTVIHRLSRAVAVLHLGENFWSQ